MLDVIEPRLMSYISMERVDDQLIVQTNNGFLRFIFISNQIVRITATHDSKFSITKGLGIEDLPLYSNWQVFEEAEKVIIKTDELKVVMDKKDGRLCYYNGSDECITKEPKYNGKELITFESYKTLLDDTTEIKKIETPDGIKEVVVNAKKIYDRQLYHTRLRFQWEADEALYGLGQNEEGILNLRGSRRYVHQGNLKIAMPFFMSTKGYGILMDTYAPIVFNDNEFGSYIYSVASEALDYYFISGADFDSIISGYRKLTGKAAMLPLWAFGLMQSQERFETQNEIIEVVKEYRKREVPLDSIVLDWRSWEDGMWGQKTFDKSRFPDARAMTDELHDLNANFMISIWPNMTKISDNYKAMKEKGYLFNRSEIYNAFDSESRELYWKQANDGLFSYGVDAWWCDSSEPYTPEWNNPVKPEPDKNLYDFHDTARQYMDERYTNAYPLVHAQTMYEGQRKTSDEKRVVNLTRSGYTGCQKYGTILWSGDTCAKWLTLKQQIAEGLNFCASGAPYWTLDIGAFFVKKGHMWFWDGQYNNTTEDLAYRELYTRWYQLGVFLPIFRAHGTDCRREIWNFGDEGDIFYDILKQYTQLRYKLMPYIYSLAGQVRLKDQTIMRLLAYDFIHDHNVYNISDQFMFGPSIMVCPIIEPMYYEANGKVLENVAKKRRVYLPQGFDWYDFYTNKPHTGGQWIEVDAPIDKIPLFIKAGAIIPYSVSTREDGMILSTKDVSQSHINLMVYTGEDSVFELYHDEGNAYAYEDGEYAITTLRWDNSKKEMIKENTLGSYKGMEEIVINEVNVI